MADRGSASFFYELFWLLDKFQRMSKEENFQEKIDIFVKEQSLLYWEDTKNYDFWYGDHMHGEEILERLGLARKGIDPDFPDSEWIYGPENK